MWSRSRSGRCSTGSPGARRRACGRSRTSPAFEFAFENYTALGYGNPLPGENRRLIGPITALNGLLLVGWSVAIIFEVMRMAELQFARLDEKDES